MPASDDSPPLLPELRRALRRAGLDAAARQMQRDAEADGDDAGVFAFEPGLVSARVALAVLRRSAPAAVRAFITWSERPDVVPFLALDRQSVAPEMEREVDAFFESGPVIDVVRYRLVREMLVKTDALARGADLAIHALTAAILADEDHVPPDEQTPLDEVVPRLLGTRDALAESIRGETEDVYTVLYHRVSVDAIEAYLRALDAPAARWYHASIGRAWADALVESFREAAALDDAEGD